MSGAEALAAFGIACNVMQVIGFAQDGIHMAKAIYKTGSLDPKLAQVIDYMKGGLERLKDSLEKGRPLVQDEQELLDIANGSLETAEILKTELDKIAGTLSKRKHSAALRGWFKAALGGKKRIERLEKEMHDRQKILENRLLARICNKNDAILLEQQDNFNRLDRELQNFIKGCARNQTTLEQLIQRGSVLVTTHIDHKLDTLGQSFEAGVSSKTSQIQDNIASHLQELTRNWIKKEEYDRLLGSLKYETMNIRRNHITDNHDDTFSWIFRHQQSNSDAGDQNQFVNWLQNPKSRPYWISGKAGSGKSVLMKFLVSNPRTQSILDAQHGTTIILSHFLWTAGHPLERSVQGLLCSLIYQLLATKPDLCSLVLEKVPASRHKRSPGDWSTKELCALSVDMIPACGQHCCIFLDGLDEMDDYVDLVSLVEQLCALPRLQVCVSSRQEPKLQNHFQGCPQLQLHIDDANTINRLVSTICTKADGVFLWVALALKSVETGYDNHDDPAELELRLQILHNDINTLYQQMWRRLNDSEDVYQKTAAVYFNLMLECIDNPLLIEAASPLLLALALHPPLAAAVVTQDIGVWEEELAKRCKIVSQQLPTRCAGLLEVTADGTVTLIHRSAQEFLTNTPEGQRIRGADQTSRETHRLNLMQGLLGCCKLEIDADAQALPPGINNLCEPLGHKFTTASFFLEWCHRYNFTSDNVHRILGLAQALYSTEEWVFDNSFYLQPDFFGAAAREGFFAWVVAELAQHAATAPRGRTMSRLYQAYLLESVFNLIKWGQIRIAAQDLAFLCALGNTPSTRNARYSTLNFVQSSVGGVGEPNPPFYLTGDPLQLLLEVSLEEDALGGRYNSLDLMINLLEGGYSVSNRTVILLQATSPKLSGIFSYELSYPRFLPGGTLCIEVNTSFLLVLFVRLLAGRQSLFPYIVDFSAFFQRLQTAVGALTTLPFSRLRGFVPEYTVHPETTFAEEDFQDVDSGHGDFEVEQSDEEDIEMKDDLDSGYYVSNDSERRAWARTTKVLIPGTIDDSNTVLAALSGDIFRSITLKADGSLDGELAMPDLESRIGQILSNATLSTVQELEECLVQDKFLVPWSHGQEVWPPSIWSSDSACDED